MKTSIRSAASVLCVLTAGLVGSARARQEGTTNPNAPVQSATTSAPATGTVVPRLAQFSSVVTDSTGKPVLGPVLITFSFYALQEGGSPLWTETQSITLDSEGRYTALLGANSTEGLPLDLFTSGAARWLGVTPDLPSTGEQPRVLMVGMPYALKAADADTLGGLPASAFVQNGTAPNVAPGAGAPDTASTELRGSPASPRPGHQAANRGKSNTGIADYIPYWNGGTTFGNSAIYQSGSNVGMGTTTPSTLLEVNKGATVGGGIYIDGSNDTRVRIGVGQPTSWSWSTGWAKAGDFSLIQEGTSGDVIYVKPGGNVGLGTTAPANTLDVNKGATVGGGINVDGSNDTRVRLGVGEPTVWSWSNGWATPGDFSLIQEGSSGDVIYVKPGGKVGISTTTPGATLEVNGTGKFDGAVTFVSGQTFPGTGTVTSVEAGTGLTTGPIGTPITGSGILSLAAATCGPGNAAIALPLACAPFATLGANAFTGTQTLPANGLTVGNNELVVTSGDVGIGTTTPAGMLDIEEPAAPPTVNAAPALQVVGGAGGPSGDVTAGNGGGITFTGGPGGDSILFPGSGGDVTLNAGIGGIGSSLTFPGGTGGNVTLNSGAGGSNLTGPGGNGGNISLQPGLGGTGIIRSGGTGNVLLASSGGLVGVATASPGNTLEVGIGGTTLADAWTVRSSRRWKTNIQTLPGALEKVEQLRGVSYDRKDTGKHEIGVIAEEVGQVVPEVVSYEKDGETASGVDYERLTALLIEGMKEQQREIASQQHEIKTQQANVQKKDAQIRESNGEKDIKLAQQATQIRLLTAKMEKLEAVQQQVNALAARLSRIESASGPVLQTKTVGPAAIVVGGGGGR